jgi:hypothetical protein
VIVLHAPDAGCTVGAGGGNAPASGKMLASVSPTSLRMASAIAAASSAARRSVSMRMTSAFAAAASARRSAWMRKTSAFAAAACACARRSATLRISSAFAAAACAAARRSACTAGTPTMTSCGSALGVLGLGVDAPEPPSTSSETLSSSPLAMMDLQPIYSLFRDLTAFSLVPKCRSSGIHPRKDFDPQRFVEKGMR